MIQQALAVTVILFFYASLIIQRRKKSIGRSEFFLWSFFWSVALLFIIFIKKVDALVAYLGFGSTGIEVLLYLAVAILFYLLFKLRLKIVRIERQITLLVRKISIEEAEK